MTRGVITKLVNTHGSEWGRISPEGSVREVYFNRTTLVDPSDYGDLQLGEAVEFVEEPDRVNGMRAVGVLRIASVVSQS